MLTLVGGLIGIVLLLSGIHYGWLVATGRFISTSYPGAALALPVDLLILPVAILSIRKEEFGRTLAVIAKFVGNDWHRISGF